MGSSASYHACNVITESVPKQPSWWQIKFSRANVFLNKVLKRSDHHVCACKAIGFPVSDPQLTSDGRQVFELFVFDVEFDDKPSPASNVGARMLCVVPPIQEEIFSSDELEVTGNFVWSHEFGGYILAVESLQILDLGFR